MSKIDKMRKELTGPHNAPKETEQEERGQRAENTAELKEEIDVTHDLVAWTKTPAGKDTVDKLKNEARKAMNEMFSVLHENPELARLISVVARYEATMQMIKRFTGAENDLNVLLSELASREQGD